MKLIRGALLVVLGLYAIGAFLPIQASASEQMDAEKLDERLSRINQSFESIEKELKEKNISENELKHFYNKLIATKKFLDAQRASIQGRMEEKSKLLKIYSDTIVSEGLDRGGADDGIAAKYKALKEELLQYQGEAAKMDAGIKRIKLLLADVTYERIRIKSTNIFTFNKPFYRMSAWTSGARDVLRIFRGRDGAAPEAAAWFSDPAFLMRAAGCIFLIFLAAFAYCKFSCRVIGLLRGYLRPGEALEVRSFKDILALPPFFIMARFFLNAYLPSAALDLAFSLSLGDDLYQIKENWFLLYSVLNAGMVAVVLYTVVSTFFIGELHLISEELVSSRPLRRRLYFLIFLIALICIVNTISIAKAAIVADPVIYPDGEALLNLFIGAVFCFNILLLVPYINWGILSRKKGRLPIQCVKATVVILAFFVPIMAFLGDSDIPVQFILKCVATVLLAFIFRFAYSLLNHTIPPAIKFVVRLLNKAALLDDKLHHSDEHEEENSGDRSGGHLLDYWVRIFLSAVMFSLFAILVLLTWGFPPDSIFSVIKIAFFNDIPIAGRATFSISLLLFSIFSAIVTYYSFHLLRYIFDTRVFPYTSMNAGTQHAVKTTIGYVGILVSVIVFIYSLGINMTALTFIISGLSVGIGFSLQELFKNLFSGFVLLVERPVVIGDILNIDGTSAVVKKIRIRSTILETANKDIVVIPNSSLINNKLINETTFTLSMVEIQVGVASKEDPHRVIEILKRTAGAHQKISRTIRPVVELLKFDESSLLFAVKVHAKRLDQAEVASELKIMIFLAFKENHVVPV
ncbi:MAG: mechanosensitive ion channel domain-containing protein [Verrucomicrobiae bacterium]